MEAWLQYGNDLGLGPYFVARTESVVSSPQVSAPPPSTSMNMASAAKSATKSVAAAAAAAAGGASSPLGTKAAPSLPIISVSSGPTLFEAAERMPNETLDDIRADLGECTRCRLHKARTKLVFGVGNPKAELVFVGEGPGHDEDIQGEPFVGRAGKLLTQMIEAMSLRREDVYICNVVKCRPPENRLPDKDEIAVCSPFLLRQLAAIQPKVICCLGACSAQTLLATTQGISRFRGEWFDFRGSKLIATYHPAYLLRNPPAKGEVWKDLQKVMAFLGLQPKKR
ncbi:MAG: uracil-DNA glycosylase [Candidatus Acidiferrales bacterium]